MSYIKNVGKTIIDPAVNTAKSLTMTAAKLTGAYLGYRVFTFLGCTFLSMGYSGTEARIAKPAEAYRQKYRAEGDSKAYAWISAHVANGRDMSKSINQTAENFIVYYSNIGFDALSDFKNDITRKRAGQAPQSP